jgi:uncharacterized YccA/Bax inhibitor family protein
VSEPPYPGMDPTPPPGAPTESGSYSQQPPTAGQGYASAYSFAQEAPNATLAQVLGWVGLIGGILSCGILFILSPIALIVSYGANRDAQTGEYSGAEKAQQGLVTGLIGTLLLVLGVSLVVAFFSLGIAGYWDS